MQADVAERLKLAISSEDPLKLAKVNSVPRSMQ